MIRATRRAMYLAAALAIVTATTATAVAGNTPFDGQVIASDKRFPTSAKSKSSYFAALRKQKKTKLSEDKDKKQWKVHFAAFFRKPLNDLEVTIKIYDVTEKKPHLKSSFESYLSERGQKEIISSVILGRADFGVNRDILLVVENGGRKLAEGKFKIVGQGEKYKGVVDFSEDEAN